MANRIAIESMTYPTDHRGLVIEPIGPDAIPLQQNVHLALTEPGHIRGNHYHKQGSEIVVVLGPALVRYREEPEGAIHDLKIPQGQAYRLRIPRVSLTPSKPRADSHGDHRLQHGRP